MMSYELLWADRGDVIGVYEREQDALDELRACLRAHPEHADELGIAALDEHGRQTAFIPGHHALPATAAR